MVGRGRRHHIIISGCGCWCCPLAHGGALTKVELLDTPLDLMEAVIELWWLKEGRFGLNHALGIRLMEERRIVHLHIVDRLYLGLVEPLNALAVLPQAELDLVVFGDDIGAESVLFAFVPVAFIAALISPRVDPKAVLFVIFVLAAVHSSVVPDVNSHALHVIVEPFSLVLAAVKPRVDADARDFIFSPISRVHRPVIPLVTADAVLAAEGVVTLVARLISPRLHAVAMLEIVLPHALVLGPIHVFVDAAAVGLVIGPIAIVNVSVNVYEATLAMGSILSPFSAVLSPIVPGLLAEAIAEASLPLTAVDGSRFESVRST